MTKFSLLAAMAGIMLFTGCSKSDTGTPASTPASGATTLHPAAKVTESFMQAIVKGDVPSANKFLTATAVAKLAANNVAFAPEGFHSATFKLGRVESPASGEAVVQCVVTMQGETAPIQQEVCWCLRVDNQQWRVMGFACDTDAGQPVLWNFETHATPQLVTPPRPAAPPLVNSQGQPVTQPVDVAQQPQGGPAAR